MAVRPSFPIALLAALALTPLALPVVGAEAPRAVAGARKAHDEMRYRRALELLRRLDPDRLDPATLVDWLETSASCHVALGELGLARNDYERLLRVAPDWRPAADASPRILSTFSQVVLPEPAPPEQPALTVHPPASPPAASTPVELRFHLAHATADRVRLFTRTAGTTSFVVTDAHVAPDGTANARVPGAHVKAPGLQFFASAVDRSGAVVAAVGSSEAPRTLPVGPVPAWKRGWVWGLVSGLAVVSAAAIAGGLAASR